MTITYDHAANVVPHTLVHKKFTQALHKGFYTFVFANKYISRILKYLNVINILMSKMKTELLQSTLLKHLHVLLKEYLDIFEVYLELLSSNPGMF